VLHQGVDVGQDRASGPPFLSGGGAGGGPRVGDQPGQHAADVGAVLSGLVPGHPGVRRPRRQRRHVRRAARRKDQHGVADRLADGGHRMDFSAAAASGQGADIGALAACLAELDAIIAADLQAWRHVHESPPSAHETRLPGTPDPLGPEARRDADPGV